MRGWKVGTVARLWQRQPVLLHEHARIRMFLAAVRSLAHAVGPEVMCNDGCGRARGYEAYIHMAPGWGWSLDCPPCACDVEDLSDTYGMTSRQVLSLAHRELAAIDLEGA